MDENTIELPTKKWRETPVVKEWAWDEMGWTAVASNVIVVVVRRVDGWCAYIGPVRGINHYDEWEQVARRGAKLRAPVAEAVVKAYFWPGLDVSGLEYAY